MAAEQNTALNTAVTPLTKGIPYNQDSGQANIAGLQVFKHLPSTVAENFASLVTKIAPNMLFTQMFSNRNAVMIPNSTHNYNFKKIDPYNGKLTTALTAVATTMVVSTTIGLVRGDLLHYPPTGETIRVKSITDGTTVKIIRSFSEAAAAIIPVNEQLVHMGNASTEGGVVPLSSMVKQSIINTNVQKVITRASATFDQLAAITRHGRQPVSLMGTDHLGILGELMIEQAYKLEMIAFFGEASSKVLTANDIAKDGDYEGDTVGTVVYTADGIQGILRRSFSNNIKTYTSAAKLNFDKLRNLLYDSITYAVDSVSGSNRVLIGSFATCSLISDMLKNEGEIHFQSIETAYGVDFTKLVLKSGITLNIMPHFELGFRNSTEGIMFLLPLDGVSKITTKIPDEVAKTNEVRMLGNDTYIRQLNSGAITGQEELGVLLSTRIGNVFKHPESMFMLKGVVAANVTTS